VGICRGVHTIPTPHAFKVSLTEYNRQTKRRRAKTHTVPLLRKVKPWPSNNKGEELPGSGGNRGGGKNYPVAVRPAGVTHRYSEIGSGEERKVAHPRVALGTETCRYNSQKMRPRREARAEEVRGRIRRKRMFPPTGAKRVKKGKEPLQEARRAGSVEEQMRHGLEQLQARRYRKGADGSVYKKQETRRAGENHLGGRPFD